MDVRMQKHRMLRWLGRVFVVLALLSSWGAQAAVEYVPPDSGWNYGYGGATSGLVNYKTSEMAIQGLMAHICDFHKAGDGDVDSCYVDSVFPPREESWQGINYTVIEFHWGLIFKSGWIEAWWDACVNNLPTCPVPVINPDFRYQLIPATGMCERNVPCLAPNVLNSSGQCVPPETYTIKLDLKTATLEPSGTASQTAKTSQSFTATVTNSTTQQPKAGAQVTIKAEVEQGSGGHDHSDQLQRPKGYLGQGSSATLCDPNALQPQACITGTTDVNGQFTFVFGSPEPSGKHTITATCDVCKDNQDQASINVKVEGLVSLSGNSTDYVLVGDTTTHSDNHYLTPTAKALAELLANKYRAKFPKDPPLHFNDASLKEGGVLDICTGIETSEGCASDSYQHYVPMCQLQPNGTYACSWSRPHIEHRRGSVIDVRANNIKPKAPNYSTSIPKRNEGGFLLIASKLKLDTGDRPHSPKSSNRHWHIRLIGVAE